MYLQKQNLKFLLIIYFFAEKKIKAEWITISVLFSFVFNQTLLRQNKPLTVRKMILNKKIKKFVNYNSYRDKFSLFSQNKFYMFFIIVKNVLNIQVIFSYFCTFTQVLEILSNHA